MALTTHHHIMLRLKKEQSYTSTPLYDFMAGCRVKFSFTVCGQMLISSRQDIMWEDQKYNLK